MCQSVFQVQTVEVDDQRTSLQLHYITLQKKTCSLIKDLFFYYDEDNICVKLVKFKNNEVVFFFFMYWNWIKIYEWNIPKNNLRCVFMILFVIVSLFLLRNWQFELKFEMVQQINNEEEISIPIVTLNQVRLFSRK